MSKVPHMLDSWGVACPQTSTDGAADVHIKGGLVGISGSMGGAVSDLPGRSPAEAVAVQSSPRLVFTALIPAGASLSGPVALGSVTAARIGCPAVVTGSGTTSLTFQTSHDGLTWKNLYDQYGNEYTVASAKLTQAFSYLLPMADFLSVQFLRIRTGTSGTPQAQSQDTAFSLTGVA